MNDRVKIGAVIALVVVVILVVVAAIAVMPRHVDVTWEGEGEVTPAGGDIRYYEDLTLTIEPSEGWYIDDVTVNGISSEVTDGTLTVGTSFLDFSAISVHVVFSPMAESTHTVTVTHTDGGAVEPSGAVEVEDGGTVTITITPEDGYILSDLRLDGRSVASDVTEYTLSDVTSDHTLHAVFSETVPELASIRIDHGPDRTVYTVGEDFDPTGMEVVAVYSDGSERDVTDGCVFSHGTFQQIGIQTVTVSYTEDGFTAECSLEVTVSAVPAPGILRIEVQTPPDRTSYSVGQRFDPTGMKVVAFYSDGGSADVTEACTFSPGVFTSSGTQTVTVSYTEDGTTVSCQLWVTVSGGSTPSTPHIVRIEVQTPPDKTVYLVGEEFDSAGMEVVAVYSDGSERDVTSGCSMSADLDDIGTAEVLITYTDGGRAFTCIQKVTVRGPSLISIAVTDPADKLIYGPGEEFDPAGIAVTATYEDDSTADVTSRCSFSHEAFDDVGNYSVTVSHTHNGRTATCSFSVLVASAEGFDTTVTSYSGTRVVDGAVTGFSETPNVALSEFGFQTSDMVPGMSQTVTVRITNGSGTALHAHVMIQELDTSGTELAEQLTVTVTHGDTTVTKTVAELAEGSFLDIGTIAHNGSETVEITLSFPEGPDNNEAMGQTVGFVLGVFADVEATP